MENNDLLDGDETGVRMTSVARDHSYSSGGTACGTRTVLLTPKRVYNVTPSRNRKYYVLSPSTSPDDQISANSKGCLERNDGKTIALTDLNSNEVTNMPINQALSPVTTTRSPSTVSTDKGVQLRLITKATTSPSPCMRDIPRSHVTLSDMLPAPPKRRKFLAVVRPKSETNTENKNHLGSPRPQHDVSVETTSKLTKYNLKSILKSKDPPDKLIATGSKVVKFCPKQVLQSGQANEKIVPGPLESCPSPSSSARLCNKTASQTPSNIPISDPDRVMSLREKRVRQMMSYVTDPHRDTDAVVQRLESIEKDKNWNLDVSNAIISGSKRKVTPHDPTYPNLSHEDVRNITELYPPMNYEPPSQESRDLSTIRGGLTDSYLPGDISTLRCIANYNVDVIDSDIGSSYERRGDYYHPDRVNFLPVQSIWTPHHSLMNTAPCVSSPGLFQSKYTVDRWLKGKPKEVLKEKLSVE